MRKVYPFVPSVTFSPTTVRYVNFWSGCDYDSPIEEDATGPWAVTGTLRYVRFDILNPPGVGKSRTFTLRKNGVDTAMAVTIADTDTEGIWEGSLAITAGDLLVLRTTPSNSPAVPNVKVTYEFDSTTQRESHYAYQAPVTSVDFYWGAFGAGQTASTTGTGSQIAAIAPISGNIVATYMNVGANALQSSTLRSTIYVNGVAQDGSGGTPNTVLDVTAGAGSTNSGSTTFTLPVSIGDLIHVEGTRVSGGSRDLMWAMRFVADTDNSSVWSWAAKTPSASSTEYSELITAETNSDWTTNSGLYASYGVKGPTTIGVHDLYLRLETAPGAGKMRDIGWARGTLSVNLSGTTTSGSDLVNLDILGPDNPETQMVHVPSGTPTASAWVLGSMVQEVDLGLDAVRLADGVIRTDAVTSIDADGFTAGTEQSQSGESHWWQAFTNGTIGDSSNQASGGIFEADVDGIYTDDGQEYESRVRTKQFVLGGILRRFGIMAAGTLVLPSSGNSLTVKLIRDYERETLSKTIDLTPTGTESGASYVLRQIDDASMSDLLSFQAEITDSSGTFGWAVDQMIFKLTDLESM